jgi:Rrf2 family protein
MQLPIKAHYAALAMLALAQRHQSDEQVAARVIAREQKIPGQFLGQILQQLRASGLIISTRGASGGFRLSRVPSKISLAEIVDAVCVLTSACAPMDSESQLSQIVSDIWEELNQKQRELLEQLTLADLLAKLPKTPAAMFYI